MATFGGPKQSQRHNSGSREKYRKKAGSEEDLGSLVQDGELGRGCAFMGL